MSTTETTAQSKTGTDATALPENAAKETMPSVEPLQMSQIDMLKIAPTRDERLFLVLSIFIGIISGLLVVSFRVAINWVQTLTLGSALQPGLLRLIFVPVIMGAVVAALVQWFFPAARGSGVNQTKAALYIYNGYISFKTVIGKFITSALAIGRRLLPGTGGPVAADRRGRGFGDQPQAGNEPAAAAAVRAGGRGCGTGGGVQRSDRGDPVRH